MNFKSKTRLAVALIAALPAFATFGTFTVFSADYAMAQGNGNGNGGGNGNGNGGGNGNGSGGGNGNAGNGGNGGNNGRGMIARELGGANAARANEQAFLNAAANSQIGRLGELRDAMAQTSDSYAEWQSTYSDYVNFRDSYDGRDVATIESDIEGLDPASLTYAEDLAALEEERAIAANYDAELARLASVSNDAAATYESAAASEEQAVLTATNGRVLSDAAMEELRAMLTR